MIVLQRILMKSWKDIHKNTRHGLTLCYNVGKVNIIKVIDTPSILEVLPVVLETEKNTFIGNSVPYA